MIAAIVWMSLIGALNVWRGTGANQWPHTVKRMAIVAALCIPLGVATHDWVITGGVYLITLIVGFSMGWGAYFDMTDRPNRDEVKWIDWVIRRLFPNDYAKQDYLGMTLRGLHFTVPQTVFLSFWNPIVLILAPLGGLMAVVYRWARSSRDLQTPAAEFVWGGILGAIYVDMALLLVL